MSIFIRVGLLLIAVFATLIATIWMVLDPGFEPLLVFLAGMGSIVTFGAVRRRRRFVISPQFIIQFIAGLTLLVSLIWFVLSPSFEPFTGLLGAFLGFGGSFLTSDEPISRDMLKFLRQFRSTRAVMLDRLRQTWLTDEDDFYIAPTFTLMPDAVSRSTLPLDFRGDISAYFSQSGGRLLLLGEPGAGKSRELISLLALLHTEARRSESAPLPVIVNLRPWQGEPFTEWLVAQLEALYELPPDIGRPWVEADYLCLLLDGLDEVAPAQQAACIAAVNAFIAEHPQTPVAVTSRVSDYTSLPARLGLNGAVQIDPLSTARVLQAAPPALQTVLREDAELLELAKLPLMLSLMIRLSEHALRFEPATTIAEKRAHIFDAFIAHQFQQVEPRFDPPAVLKWVGWLGHQMAVRGQPVFMLENLDPSWLPTKRARAMRRLLVVGALLVAAVVNVGLRLVLTTVTNVFDSPALFDNPFYWLGTAASGLLTMLFYLIIYALMVRQPQTARWPRVTLRSMLVLIALGLVFSFPRAVAIYPVFADEWIGIMPGIITSTTDAFVVPNTFTEAQTVAYARWFAVAVSYVGTLVSFVSIAVVGGLMVGQVARPRVTTGRLLFSWQRAGQGCLVGVLLFVVGSVVTAGVCLLILALITGAAPLFVELPTDSGIIGAVGLTASGLLFYGVGLGIVLTIGTIPVGLMLLYGIEGRTLEETVEPNQGIQQAAQNARFAFAFIGGLVGVFACGLFLVLFALTSFSSMFGSFGVFVETVIGALAHAVFIVLLYGIPAALVLGGRDLLTHYTTRAMLTQGGQLPAQPIDFLQHATDLVFMKRVGGGYVFTHRLLHEHLMRQVG